MISFVIYAFFISMAAASFSIRPFPPPLTKEEINVTLKLIKSGWGNFLVVNPLTNAAAAHGHVCSNCPLVFVIHGFYASGDSPWMARMSRAYLRNRENANVFIVDWGSGALYANYLKVAANTRVVADVLISFLQNLIASVGQHPSNVHIIGHSLGAHIAGYTGKGVRGISRITGLDPAQIGFEGYPAKDRLDVTDAYNVDVLHTNAKPTIPTLGLGFVTGCGAVDFYLNGGSVQPGCLVPSLSELQNIVKITSVSDIVAMPVKDISRLLGCSHSRSIEYFIEALEQPQCVFWGYKIGKIGKIFNAFTMGMTDIVTDVTSGSKSCSAIEDCIPIGLDTFSYPGRGIFAVTTAMKTPYCRNPNIGYLGKLANKFKNAVVRGVNAFSGKIVSPLTIARRKTVKTFLGKVTNFFGS